MYAKVGAIQLIELDLRDTKVTDLTNLNDYGTALTTLRVNCTDTHEVEKITYTYYYTKSGDSTVYTTHNLWETYYDGITVTNTEVYSTETVTECKMDLSTIETVINHLSSAATYWYYGRYTGYQGLYCGSIICFETLSKTTGLTQIYSNQWTNCLYSTTIEVDLRNNKNLTSVTSSGWYFKVYLPKNILTVNADQGWPPIIRSWNWSYFVLY